jgi:hypothetical protein
MQIAKNQWNLGQSGRGMKRGRRAADDEAEEEDVEQEGNDAEFVTLKQIKELTRSISSLARLVKAVVAQRKYRPQRRALLSL